MTSLILFTFILGHYINLSSIALESLNDFLKEHTKENQEAYCDLST